MTPSFTDHVSGAQFTFTQPSKSRPLNNGLKSESSSAAKATAAERQAIRNARRIRFSKRFCLRVSEQKKRAEKRSPPVESVVFETLFLD
jgi:hypothetical protein